MHPKVNEGNCSFWTFQNLTICIILIELCRVQGEIITKNKDVEVGGRVTLRCTLSKLYDTIQVTWQKEMNGSVVNMATYQSGKGPNILPPYNHQINFTVLGVNDTAITFWNASIQDDGCYRCIFNTFPLGSVTGKPCLSVYTHLSIFIYYKTSDRHTNATCFASGFPRPSISWLPPGHKMNENLITNPNGTVSVMRSIFANTSGNHAGQELICRVKHRRKEVDLKLALLGRGHNHQDYLVLILLALMPMIILMN
ncbi:OX-2 membrane glycoprotein-like [Sceloporus undulatus]|uniref:OX-2 membrane glycoprotein-like n=1 Tax=Sceloporus undulatus TaxID=8520 RepID=UPI001C4D82F9|nr:OX-2 membrane glycoprotein-like [Sceloporus undulatus]